MFINLEDPPPSVLVKLETDADRDTLDKHIHDLQDDHDLHFISDQDSNEEEPPK